MKIKNKKEQNSSYYDFFNRKRLMKINRFFSRTEVFTGFYVAAVLVLLGLILWLLLGVHNFSFRPQSLPEFTYLDIVIKYKKLELVYIVCAAAGYIRFAYIVKVSQGSLDIGQKGTARWTTREELRAQYRWVAKNEFTGGGSEFPGIGGIPVAREKDKIAIDDTNTNNLVIGTTRSGKGQIIVNPMIDILSRAKEKCSMIVTDPKLELSFMAIPKLIERGYECHILNLVDTEYSMGYNPYTTIVDEYKSGNEDKAQQLCASLGYNIFAPQPGEKDPFWTDQARNVFVAMSMAEVEDAIKADEVENKRYKQLHEKNEQLREEAYYRELYGNDYANYKLRLIVDELKRTEGNISEYAIMDELLIPGVADEFRTYIDERLDLSVESEDEESIYYKNFDEACHEFLKPILNLKLKESRFKKEPFYEHHTNADKITVYSIIKMCTSLLSEKANREQTMLDKYFDTRSEESFARITYGSVISASEQTKGTIISVFRKQLDIFGYNGVAKLTAKSSIKFSDIAFSEKPVAIFIGLPDYDASKHFIATVFINQMYFTLAKLATAMPKGKLPRRVHFILDEFGNLPPLDNLSNIVTVCLGREIVFTFIVQALAQIKEKYGNSDSTIIGNCGNQFFIMSSDINTAEEFSKTLSTESITTTNRTGKKLSINKEITEMTDERPLLSAYELMHLELGEMVLVRGMKRTDVKGEKIKATPIANMGEYRMEFAHEFLDKSFPAGQQLYESPALEEIRKQNKMYSSIKPKIVDVGIETTTSIDLRKCSRSPEEYMKHQRWRNKIFPCTGELTMSEKQDMNMMFFFIGASESDIEKYQKAGSVIIDQDGKQQILYPEMVLRNGYLEDYAYDLLKSSSRQTREKGYGLYDLLLPLPPREKTEEEYMYEQQQEAELIAKGRGGDDFA